MIKDTLIEINYKSRNNKEITKLAYSNKSTLIYSLDTISYEPFDRPSNSQRSLRACLDKLFSYSFATCCVD